MSPVLVSQIDGDRRVGNAIGVGVSNGAAVGQGLGSRTVTPMDDVLYDSISAWIGYLAQVQGIEGAFIGTNVAG